MQVVTEQVEKGAKGRLLTWPNLITAVRLVVSPGLIILALCDQLAAMAVLAVVLVFTEWLDGFLARQLHEESAIGARLDTIADAVFYVSLLVALVVVNPAVIGREVIWITAATLSYLLSWLVSWIKFRQLPSYHSWAAKGAWVVVGIGTLCLLAGWVAWPFRAAMSCVVLANTEAVLITLILEKCRVDVPSLWHALRSGS